MHIKDGELATTLSAQLGEKLAAAAYARVNTRLGAARMFTPLGNYLVARPAARSAARKITEATDMPLDAAMVIGITDQALHVWTADPMLNQVRGHLGSVPLSRVTAIRVEPGRAWHEMRIGLDDGNEITIEARGAAHAIASAYDHRGIAS